MKITVYIIDNYDSFTYNLYQMIGEILLERQNKQPDQTFEIIVKHNDQVTLAEITRIAPDYIIISPGPGSPKEVAYFGICDQVIKNLGKSIPILGVCLGMQGIVHAFGGDIVHAPLPMHGKTSILSHDGKGLFEHLPQGLEIMRYHSLMADVDTFPECLEITAIVSHELNLEQGLTLSSLQTKDYQVMAVAHKTYPIAGIQFHPESFLSECGKELLSNFLTSKK